jgi:hypothetical protein
MIPARLTGKPFWDIYLFDDPPLGEAYLEAIRILEMDGWYLYGNVVGGSVDFSLDADSGYGVAHGSFYVPRELVSEAITARSDSYMDKTIEIETPHGALEMTTRVYRNAPPWDVTNLVKNVSEDWPKLKWLMGSDWWWDSKCSDQEEVGEAAVYGIQVQSFVDFWDAVRDGQSDRMLFDFYDTPALMQEIFEFYRHFALHRTRGLIEAGVDEILMQGSNSSLSLINPEIYKHYVLPLNVDITRITRELGCLGHLHTCGRSREIVEYNMEQADFDVIEPLEKPPSGNVDLAEIKRRFGDRVALKGNMLTSGVLLSGSPRDVEREVIETLRAAGEGGGFILSSGDQVGGNTPLENLRAMVDAGRRYGRYDEAGRLRDLPEN